MSYPLCWSASLERNNILFNNKILFSVSMWNLHLVWIFLVGEIMVVHQRLAYIGLSGATNVGATRGVGYKV